MAELAKNLPQNLPKKVPNLPGPPRVQLVSRLFAPEAAAAALRLEALTAQLAGQGARVQVLTTFPAPGTDRHARAGVEKQAPGPGWVRVERHQAWRDKTGYIRGYLPYLSFDILSFFRLLRRVKPDVYVAEPPPTTGAMVRVLAALRCRPYVYYAADVWSDAAAGGGVNPLVVRALALLEGFALRGASAVIAVSPGVAERVAALTGSKYGAQNIHIVPNGIDTGMFTLTGPTPEPLPGFTWHGGPLLVYAGTASSWQGAQIFAHAFAQIHRDFPRAQLLFLGQGTSWEEIGQVARALPADTIGLSQCDPAQAAAWQRAATACLVSIKPGQGYDFAYPTKALAALACGTPVVYAGVGPLAEDIVQNSLGWTANWDVAAVARALRQALETAPANTAEAGGPLGGEKPAEVKEWAEKLRTWVENNRSVRVSSARAATVVLETLPRY